MMSQRLRDEDLLGKKGPRRLNAGEMAKTTEDTREPGVLGNLNSL